MTISWSMLAADATGGRGPRLLAVAGDAEGDLGARQDLLAGFRRHRADLRAAREQRVEEAARVLGRDLQAEALELLLRGVGVAADEVGERHALLAHDPQRGEVRAPPARAARHVDQVRARLQ